LNEHEFDPALDALYNQAVNVAQEFGWPVPARPEFEARYKEELAALRDDRPEEPE
jgi:hypothetical protein